MRAIWLDDDFFDIHSEVELSDALAYLWRAYNAAPADPVEAVRQVLRDSVSEWGEGGWTHDWAPRVAKALGWEKP